MTYLTEKGKASMFLSYIGTLDESATFPKKRCSFPSKRNFSTCQRSSRELNDRGCNMLATNTHIPGSSVCCCIFTDVVLRVLRSMQSIVYGQSDLRHNHLCFHY